MIMLLGILAPGSLDTVPKQTVPRTTLQNATTTASAGSGLPSPETWYPVKRVVDGDTIVVIIGTKLVKVRLIGLDTPETVDPRKPVQCFAKEASAEASKILTGVSVRLETDPSQDTYDKYGRLLAYVFVPLNSNPEGLLFNQYMIREGYGHEYTYDLPYKYQKQFKAAEKSAREQKKGLWSDGVCPLN